MLIFFWQKGPENNRSLSSSSSSTQKTHAQNESSFDSPSSSILPHKSEIPYTFFCVIFKFILFLSIQPNYVLCTKLQTPIRRLIIACASKISTFYTENTPAARRNLRSTIEKRSLSINEEFLLASDAAQQALDRVGEEVNALAECCDKKLRIQRAMYSMERYFIYCSSDIKTS